MPCECGYADECDGEYATHYPLQDGGMCAVTKCRQSLQRQIQSCKDEVAAWPAWMKQTTTAPTWMKGWDD
jgi:hypothetical protein